MNANVLNVILFLKVAVVQRQKYGKVVSKIAVMGLMNKVGKLSRKLSYNVE